MRKSSILCYNLNEGKLPLLEEASCFPHLFKSEEASVLTSPMTCVGCLWPRPVEQLSLIRINPLGSGLSGLGITYRHLNIFRDNHNR